MDTTYWITCALCIIFLRLPLYNLAPVENISYIDVMNKDTNLCNNSIKQFLSKSEYTKKCATLSYLQTINQLDDLKYETMDKFLCLGMYDATYKVCRYVTNKKWNSTFSNTEDLDSSIQNVTGFKSNGEVSSKNSMVDEKIFCHSLVGYTPIYEKVKPALLKLVESLKDPGRCNKICIDIDSKLNPLCAVLAWINWIDQTVTNSTIITSNSDLGKIHNNKSNISQPVKHREQHLTTNTNVEIPPGEIQIVQGKKQKSKILSSNDANQFQGKELKPTIPPSSNATLLMPKQVMEEHKTKDNSQIPNSPRSTTTNGITKEGSSFVEKSNKNNDVTKSKFKNSTSTVSESNVSQPVKALDASHSETDGNIQQPEAAIANEHQSHKGVEPEKHNKNSDVDKIVNTEGLIQSTEEIKSTTLSENTQDNVVEDNAINNRNQDDFSRDDDEQLPINSIDSLNQPVNADNRNENMPELSDQREVENGHTMKSDEESHFFTYFAITSLGFIGGYIAYHNKQKILAIVLEGRRSKNNRGRRRPSTANYRKLDCTLEEAVTSQCNANVTHVIY